MYPMTTTTQSEASFAHAHGQPSDASARLEDLIRAERNAFDLVRIIEDRGVIRSGRTEREIEQEILSIATNEFGIEQHWHKRIVRAGVNTLAIFAENPPVLTVKDDDIVFIDLGPVFDNWEADVGKSFVVGSNPDKVALVAELERQFDLVEDHLAANPHISGADLYRYACDAASAAGFKFGGQIAGHIVAEFPHARLPGSRQAHHISLENPCALSDLDPLGNKRYWIIEIHLVAPDGKFGGFYERLANKANRLI